MFIISLIGLIAIVGIIYAIIPIPEVLWIGGALVFFWVSDRIRQEIEDNVYINAAYVSVMAVITMIPQIFLGGTILGLIIYVLSSLYLGFQIMTHRDHLSTFIRRRDFDPIWRSDHSHYEKQYMSDVIANGNLAGIILVLIGFNAAMLCFGMLIYEKSLWFALIPPAFVLLCNAIFILYMQIVGVEPPRGFSCHHEVSNILQGYGYLVKKVWEFIFNILYAPIRFIRFIAEKIVDFFDFIRDGSSLTVGIAFWICLAAIGVYDLLGFFGLIDEVDALLHSLGSYEYSGYQGLRLTELSIAWMSSWPPSFLLDVVLVLLKLVLIVVPFVLDLVLMFLGMIGWFLYMVVLELFILAFMSFLPAILLAGAITFLVFYLIDSNRDGSDIFRFVFFTAISVVACVLYYLFLGGVIVVF